MSVSSVLAWDIWKDFEAQVKLEKLQSAKVPKAKEFEKLADEIFKSDKTVIKAIQWIFDYNSQHVNEHREGAGAAEKALGIYNPNGFHLFSPSCPHLK